MITSKKPISFAAFVKLFFKILKIALVSYAILFSIVSTIVVIIIFNLVNKPVTDVVFFKSNNPKKTAYMKQYSQKLREEKAPDSLQQKFIPLDSISSFLVNSVLAAEDDGFYVHPGIDIEAILTAMEYNRTQGEIKHGASTITQQLAKNLFLSSERTYNRKVMELVYTFLLERYLGKRRILELYLNYAQWGKNIFGCEAASRFYYKKSCSNLTRNEAARLAAVLSMPSKLTPLHKTNYMGKRIGVIAQNMYLHKTIDDSEYFSLTGTLPPPKEGASAPKDSLKTDSTSSQDTLTTGHFD